MSSDYKRRLAICLRSIWQAFSTCLLIAWALTLSAPAAGQDQLLLTALARPVAQPSGLQQPELVRRFYQLNGGKPFWVAGEAGRAKRVMLQTLWAGSAVLGLDQASYEKWARVPQWTVLDTDTIGEQALLALDMHITDAALTFCKDLYAGTDMKAWVSYDELSLRCAAEDDDLLVKGLQGAGTASALANFVRHLEPEAPEYWQLRAALRLPSGKDSSFRMRQLQTSLNFYRWLHHFHLTNYVVVNIASATIRYYQGDSVRLKMKAVVGTPDTKTPRFAAYCTGVLLYPYWNVPRSIAVKELLPRFRKSPGLVSLLNMEVLDSRGRVVPPSAIAWKSLNSAHFPYRFREKTGCFNPLGVVKFEITDPYSVYLHDTNFKGAFLASNRYYSHGCIRVEDPVALANALLQQPVDTAFLMACYKDQQPIPLKLDAPVPVFTVYMTAEVDAGGQVQYFRDVYDLLR